MVKNPDQIREAVGNVVGALKTKGVKINKLILYGSYANGDPGPDSDIDLAVISRSFDRRGLLKRQELLGEAILGLKEPVELIGYSYREYQRRPPFTLLSLILSQGKVVYEE